MALLLAVIWLLTLPGIGALFLRHCQLGFGYQLLSTGILGSAITAVVFLTLSHFGQLDSLQVTAAAALLSLAGAVGWARLLSVARPPPWHVVRELWHGMDAWDRRLAWAGGVCLVIILLDAGAPPRGADAMRYHLAQMEDLVRNHGFVFRPYYHYNFPLYYSHLAMPLYILVGGAGVKLFNFLFLGVVAAVTYGLGRVTGVGRPLIPVLGLLLTPGILRAATTVNSDLGVLSFGLGGVLLLHAYQRARRRSFLLLAYVAFGFAMGIKYQSVLFLPWYLWLTWVGLGRRLDWSLVRQFAALGLIAVLLPAPFFIRNYLNTGVPDWPLHQDLFAVDHDYVYDVTMSRNRSLTGAHDLETTSSAMGRLVTSGLHIPSMWIFALVGGYRLLRRGPDPTGLYLGVGIVAHLILWWILQPNLYPRFVNYLIPQLMVAAVFGFDMLEGLRIRRAATALAVASAGLGLVGLAVYSEGLVRYHLDGDLGRYHEYTWFYDDYRWMDTHLPADANVLVVVSGGATYYAPRPYLRADPSLSGLIDWREMDERALYDEMRRLEIDHVFYEDRDWSMNSIGGAELMEVMKAFVERDDVQVLWKRAVALGTSRVRRQAVETQTWMLKIGPPDRDRP